jgi:GH15 family glucan-1,4-alpha-glucosidase
MHSGLYDKSIEIVLNNQSEWGSYIACPDFPTYHFSWLRDGSFIAHAMDCAGQFDSAEAFYRWLGRTIDKYGYKLENLRKIIASGKLPGKDEALHTRFTLDGQEDFQDETWGNFQMDGYGTWLWALYEHVRMAGNTQLLMELRPAVEITVEYLSLVWNLPNYDCWEEFPEFLHTYSLGAVYAGFHSAAEMQAKGWLEPLCFDVEGEAKDVKDFILKHAIVDQRLAKMIQPENIGTGIQPVGDIGVDASLLGVMIPYNVLDLDDPILIATMQQIEQHLLHPDGGIYRYASDEYYGGGEWILLTAWLGWVYARMGKLDKARTLQAWIESCADEKNQLPEQVNDHPLLPERYQPWIERWGAVAKPLLWSHAMYIILIHEINKGKTED